MKIGKSSQKLRKNLICKEKILVESFKIILDRTFENKYVHIRSFLSNFKLLINKF